MTIHWTNRQFALSLASAALVLGGTVTAPVSYTHLDVYKRQSLNASRVVHPRDHLRLGTAILRTHFLSLCSPLFPRRSILSFLEREHASFIPRRPTRTRPELPHPHTHYQQDHSPRYGDEGADP